MLTASEISEAVAGLVDLWAGVESDMAWDIARRIVKAGETETARWQAEKLLAMGAIQADSRKALEAARRKQARELTRTFTELCKRALAKDDAIYRAAGLKPGNITPALMDGCHA